MLVNTMRNETAVDSNKVKEEIEGLRHLTVGKLKDRYREVFGEESRSNHKQFLFRRVAWRMNKALFATHLSNSSKCGSATKSDIVRAIVELKIQAVCGVTGPWLITQD